MLYEQGIETVRRDNCLLVRNVVTTCLEKILIDRNVQVRASRRLFSQNPSSAVPAPTLQDAITYVKNTISELLMNKIDLSLLVISKVHRARCSTCAALHA